MNLSIHEIAAKLGIKRGVTNDIIFDIKINNYLLENCTLPHDFSVVLDRRTKQPIQNPTPMQRFEAKFKCSKCDGQIGGIERIWYEKGVRDGITSTEI